MFDTTAVSPEVAANRTSQITDIQRKRLRNSLLGFGFLTLLFVGLPGLMLVGGVASLLSDGAQFDSGAWAGMLCLGVIGLGSLGLALMFASRFVLTWQDMSESRVEQGDGEIAWRGSNYRAEVNGRRLTLQDVHLAPGPYRFYYLPRLGRVLSAEKLAMGSGGAPDDELRSALAQANKFRLEALTDLRAGRLGELRGPLLRDAWVTAGVTTLIAGGFAAFMAVTMISGGAGAATLIPLAIAGGFILLFVWSAVNVTRDVNDDKVATAQGRVRRLVRRSRRSASYYYTLDRLQFYVSGAAYNALVEGREYRLYYLPRSKKLVGIEPVDR
jgi:hypothetical protein